jgi:ABC-2 type transport system ATP-binding protein
MIQADSLTKYFGPIKAVDGVSFKVGKGEVLGFLGPNGAGKSTTMKTLCGFLTPTAGTASICGFDIVQNPIEAKQHLGYLPEGAPAYADMTPRSYLAFIAGIRGLSGSTRAERIEKTIDTLSKGFKRRVGLAQALLDDPDVLVLDEPTDGLDPNQKHEVRKLIREMAPKKAIIISTHLLEEVTAVCSRAIIIASGRVVADGTPEEMEARSRHHNAVTLKIDKDSEAAAAEELRGLDEVANVQPRGGGVLIVYPKDGRSIIATVNDLARSKKWPVEEVYAERGHLDEVFREITQTAA